MIPCTPPVTGNSIRPFPNISLYYAFFLRVPLQEVFVIVYCFNKILVLHAKGLFLQGPNLSLLRSAPRAMWQGRSGLLSLREMCYLLGHLFFLIKRGRVEVLGRCHSLSFHIFIVRKRESTKVVEGEKEG